MGKTSKWIRNFLTGKKPKDKGYDICNDDSSIPNEIPKTPLAVPPNTPKEKKRWSFGRSGSGNNNVSRMDSMAITPRIMPQPVLESQKAGTAPKATASDIRLSSASRRRSSALQDVAATMIQAVFRSYLARKALCALKGLVKLQALVRGHLVRKQAISTLRCMQALVNVQVRTRALRLQRSSTYNMDKHLEDSIKHVQMDRSEPKASTRRRRNSYSPAFQDASPKIYSRYFDEYSMSTEQSSPNCCSNVSKQDVVRVTCYSPQLYDKTVHRNYMVNTESFKAKARSKSAPKQRLDLLERQKSRKKVSMEGRNAHGAIRMQRSSTHVGSGAQRHQFPWSNKLDSTAVSPENSECDSTSTVITHTNYCRTVDAYEVSRY